MMRRLRDRLRTSRATALYHRLDVPGYRELEGVGIHYAATVWEAHQCRADPVAVRMGGLPEIRGAAAVAETFKGRAQAAKPALIDGAVGIAVIQGHHDGVRCRRVPSLRRGPVSPERFCGGRHW